MTRVTVSRTIAASPETIFRAISDIPNLPDTVPDIVRVEMLSETSAGVGTRFRETRVMNGKESVTELEVTEYRAGERVRMVADSHGTVWDSVFTVKPTGEAAERAELTITMDARAHKLLPRLLNPVFKGLYRKGLLRHVDAVKAYCEHAETDAAVSA